MGLIKWLTTPPLKRYGPTAKYGLRVINLKTGLIITCGVHADDAEMVLAGICTEFNEHLCGVRTGKQQIRIAAHNAIDFADKNMPVFINIDNRCIVSFVKTMDNVKTMVATKLIKEVMADEGR